MDYETEFDAMMFPGMELGEPEIEVPEPPKNVGSIDIHRWSSWMKPYPLPPHLTPGCDMDWQGISDDTLMTMPPSLIAHLQRTSAQGGMQVVSPRQIPFTSLLGRTMDTRRDICDYVVGSTADTDSVWPTMDDADFDAELPDEPLPVRGSDVSNRERTRTEPITASSSATRDPVVACLIKGRAVIDLLSRDDVAGDAVGYCELLAEAWGVPTEQIMELDAYTLGLDGPLLRHALRVDDVYPMVHAPVHRKLCVGVGNSEITRELLPEGSAMDWRRMRVFCEAHYMLNCAIESIPLKEARCYPPPGDPTAPLTRGNILAYRPLPCTAWTFEASTFSIVPVFNSTTAGDMSLPTEVLTAVGEHLRKVRPVTYVVSKGVKPTAKRSRVLEIDVPAGETISMGYITTLAHVSTGGARGRTAAATVRNVIFETIDNAPLPTQLRLARYIHIANKEVKAHLGLTIVPDGIIDRLAMKIVGIGESVRCKIAAEATRRGASLEGWWSDILAQAPLRYSDMAEGTMGWMKVGLWLLFRSPTDKWHALASATHFSALREAEMRTVGYMTLPPEKGSIGRILGAARGVVTQVARAYAGYYSAVYDIGIAMAEELDSVGKNRSAAILREASYLWMLRARALRGTNVHPIEKYAPCKSPNHLRVEGTTVDLVIAPAPYRAMSAYRAHIKTSKVLSQRAVRQIETNTSDRISDVFRDVTPPMAPAKESVLTRYLLDPARLGKDMERSWGELRMDLARVVATMDKEVVASPRRGTELLPGNIGLGDFDFGSILENARKNVDRQGYTFLTALMDVDEVEFIEYVLEQIDPVRADVFMETSFEDVDDLRRQVMAFEAEISAAASTTRETVG